uniref:Chaperonin GroEL n=1 Tax=uncultured virus TaxID=340016 RepID=A0A240F754_9VIRU|nr:chaperonin GroEL [uncultured virus]
MTETSFGTELKNKLLEGVRKLNNSVASTLGPAGRTVLIKEHSGEIKVTKDGVTVAKAFQELEDQTESIGAELAKKVSIKSANEVGDGTTTSTVLATAILEEGIKQINDGSNPVNIKKGIDEAVSTVVSKLKEMATEITDDSQIKEVATISGNNDTEIGNLIATALDKVGRDGIVTIEESKTGETSLEVVEGMQFDRGFKSPYFVTDNDAMAAILDDPYVLIFDGRITQAAELLNVLNKVSSESKPLLIVAEDIDNEALATLIVNKMRGTVQVVAVKAPDFGDRRTMALEDLATVTGGQVLSKNKGHKLDKLQPIQFTELLGSARKVSVTKETTTIIDGKGTEEAITERAASIKTQLDNASSAFEKEKLQERLGKLIGGVAIINVGGNSEIEIKEKKDRVEDALFATKAALDEGIVAGGGTALLYAAGAIDPIGNDDIAIGRRIVKQAITEPFIKILTNAGHDINDIRFASFKLIDSGNNLWAGLNFKDLRVIDYKKEGIIDPKKVTRIALENAASIAGTILTTESVVYEKREDKQQETPNPMAGMM